MNLKTTLTIGALAETGSVNVETIRYYERRGLLPPPARSASGYRQYTHDDVWRLGFILRAKTLGFSLGEIRELLGADGDRSVDGVRRVTGRRLAAIEADLAELARRRDDLRSLLRTCEGDDEAGCLGLAVARPDR